MTRSAFLTLAVLAAAALPTAAQTPSVAGLVRDSAGRPIPLAEVSVGALRTRTDSIGHFYLGFPKRDRVTVEFRRLGYQRVSVTLSVEEATGNDLDVVLNPTPFALPEVSVEDPGFRSMTPLGGFDERRALGVGEFITRDDILRRNTYTLADVLRDARGVVLTRARTGRMMLRFALYQSKGCDPLMWVDGQRAPGLEIDAIAAPDVEGIELYQTMATTPMQFTPTGGAPTCGTVVVWTKRPIARSR